MNNEKYYGYTNSTELYFSFKEEFFTVIDEKLAEWNVVDLIKEWYIDQDFEKIRILLDDRTETWKNKALESIEDGISDRVYNTAYRSWKSVEDMYMVFYEVYNDLIELNTI